MNPSFLGRHVIIAYHELFFVSIIIIIIIITPKQRNMYNYNYSNYHNFGEWVESMGVASGCG